MKAQLKNLWDAVKAVLRWKFIESKEYIRKKDLKAVTCVPTLGNEKGKRKLSPKNAEEKKKD